MKIGSFWGLPAPMILILDEICDGNFELDKYVDLLDYRLNSSVLENFRKEFLYFEQKINTISGTMKSELITNELVTVLNNCRSVQLNKGKFIGDLKGSDEDTLLNYCTLQFSISLVDAIIQGESKGQFYDIDPTINGIRSLASEYINSNVFPIAMLKTKATLYAKTLVGGSVVYGGKLAEEFSYVKVYSPMANINGVVRKPSDNTLEVFNWFVSKLDTARKFRSKISVGTREENIVFGRPLSEIIRNNPNAIKYTVIRDMEFLKTTKSQVSALRFISKYKDMVYKYKDLLATQVIVDGSNIQDAFTMAEARSIESTVPHQAMQLINKIKANKYLLINEVQKEDYEVLCKLAEDITKVTLENINTVLGIRATKEEWEDVIIPELVSIGICGLNLHTQELFVDSVDGITLLANTKIIDTAENFEKRQTILKDIENLLESILPIGTELEGV